MLEGAAIPFILAAEILSDVVGWAFEPRDACGHDWQKLTCEIDMGRGHILKVAGRKCVKCGKCQRKNMMPRGPRGSRRLRDEWVPWCGGRLKAEYGSKK